MRYIVTIFLTLALACGSVLAQEDMTGPKPSFTDLDSNSNGYVSKREAAGLPCLSKNFSNIDKRSDQGLSRSEFSQAVAEYCDNQ